MIIPAGHILKSAYVQTCDIVFTSTIPMAVAAVEEKVRQFTAIGPGQAYPLPFGEWQNDRFHLKDGRHRYLASLILGRQTMLVAWIEAAEE